MLLLRFRDEESGEEYTWCPAWDDVRKVYSLAIKTEWENEGPYTWGQTESFLALSNSVASEVTVKAKDAVLADITRLQGLADSGNFDTLAEIVRTDLPRVARLLAQGDDDPRLKEAAEVLATLSELFPRRAYGRPPA